MNNIGTNGWIPINLRLPEDIKNLPRYSFKSNGIQNISIRVLVYDSIKDRISIAIRNLGMRLNPRTTEPEWAWIDVEMSNNITYWMPLPNKP